MPKYLAIDWDPSEARFVYASASARGSRLRILAAENVPLTAIAEQSADEACTAIGAQLRAALDRHSIGRVPTLVCIERTGMELLPLSLPPAADAELPELVANEVLRDSAAAAEGAFDFFISGDDSAAARKVAAAVLPAEPRKRIDATAEAARLRLQRVVPRFLAAASMFQRLVPPSDEWHLLVHPGTEEVDFVVFRAGQMVFARTARLPSGSSDDQRDSWLEGEIHRTLTVAATESGEPHIIEGVYVFGGREEYLGLCERVRDVLLLPAHGLNPLEEYELPPDFAPEHPGRFAALLGMLLDEAEHRPPTMDFLHPHRPARRVGRIKMSAYGGAAVLLLAVIGGGYLWHNLSKVWQDNRQLAVELKRLDGEVGKDAKTRQLVRAINSWEQGDVVWLDELREFSQRFPPARDAMALRMSLISPGGGHAGGMITFQALVRDPSLIVRLEYALRNSSHVVQSRRIQSGSRPDEDYSHLFDASIAVGHRTKKDQVADTERR